MSNLAGVAEAAVLERWLDGLLRPAPTLMALVGDNTYRAPAPDPLADLTPGLLEGTAVVYQFLAGTDSFVVNTGPRRILARDLFVVKAVGPRDVDLEPVATVLEVLLAGAQGAQDGLSVAVQRAGTVNYPEVAAGRLYDHLGATWRLEIG